MLPGSIFGQHKNNFFYQQGAHVNYRKIELYLTFNSEIPYKDFIRTCRLEIAVTNFAAMVRGFEIYPWLFREMIFLHMSYPMAGVDRCQCRIYSLKLKAKENHHSCSENRHIMCTPLQQLALSKSCKVGRRWSLRCSAGAYPCSTMEAVLALAGRTAWSPWLLPWGVCSKHFWEVW